MVDDYALALQGAVVTALMADDDLADLVGEEIYGRRVPDTAVRPYVWINNIVVRDLRSSCGQAATVTFGVEAVSGDDVAADVEASRCAAAVNAVLEGAALSVSGHTLVQIHRLTETSGQSSDGSSFEVVSAYSAVLDR